MKFRYLLEAPISKSSRLLALGQNPLGLSLSMCNFLGVLVVAGAEGKILLQQLAAVGVEQVGGRLLTLLCQQAF
jgi:hypothetical protein